jgi:hypothetical protein
MSANPETPERTVARPEDVAFDRISGCAPSWADSAADLLPDSEAFMQIHVDLSTIPPQLELREADDFTRFSVTASSVAETHVARDVLESLAGKRASDPDWRRELQGMLDYAQGKGWIRGDGAIQAHVEWHS